MGLCLSLLLSGCSAPPPPPPAPAPKPAAPPAPPAKEPIESGNACVKVEAQCGGSVCLLFIKNDCDTAVSCDATMTTTCRQGESMVESARRKRDTFAAKTSGELSLQGECGGGQILATAMKSLACK